MEKQLLNPTPEKLSPEQKAAKTKSNKEEAEIVEREWPAFVDRNTPQRQGFHEGFVAATMFHLQDVGFERAVVKYKIHLLNEEDV
jgi:hypothetical protein